MTFFRAISAVLIGAAVGTLGAAVEHSMAEPASKKKAKKKTRKKKGKHG
jgi:hypothetical protein